MPLVELMFTIDPPPASIMAGTVYFMPKNTPTWLTLTTRM